MRAGPWPCLRCRGSFPCHASCHPRCPPLVMRVIAPRHPATSPATCAARDKFMPVSRPPVSCRPVSRRPVSGRPHLMIAMLCSLHLSADSCAGLSRSASAATQAHAVPVAARPPLCAPVRAGADPRRCVGPFRSQGESGGRAGRPGRDVDGGVGEGEGDGLGELVENRLVPARSDARQGLRASVPTRGALRAAWGHARGGVCPLTSGDTPRLRGGMRGADGASRHAYPRH
jgi:hypothetical protein